MIPPRNITASGVSAPGSRLRGPYSDILIYPVVAAPNAIELLEGMSLKGAFWQFVLRDPEVELMGARAIADAPDLKRVYLEGWCYPDRRREWPLVFHRGQVAGGRTLDSPIGYLGDPPPGDVQHAADVLSDRYESLLTLLRQGKLDAVGDPTRSRGNEAILGSIWSPSAYFFDAAKGDLLQTNGSADSSKPFSIRWRAVTLRRPMHADLFHVKPPLSDQMLSSTIEPHRHTPSLGRDIVPNTTPHKTTSRQQRRTPHRASVADAIACLWPEGIPDHLQVQKRDQMIIDWQKENGRTMTGPRTIATAVFERTLTA